MNKREAVKEIKRCSTQLSVSNIADKALKGEVSLSRALHHTAQHATKLHIKIVAERAIDND